MPSEYIDVRGMNLQGLKSITSTSNNPEVYLIVLYLLLLRNKGILNTSAEYSAAKITEEIRFRIYEQNHEVEKLNEVTDFIRPEIEKLDDHFLHKLIDFVNSVDLKILQENLSDVFEKILEASYDKIGPAIGEHVLPKEISKFISYLVKLPKNAMIYNPFSGLGSFGLYSRYDVNYIGQELNGRTASIAVMRLLASNKGDLKKITQGDSIRNWNPLSLKYHLIISSPPFGMPVKENIAALDYPTRTADYYIIQRGLKDLRKNGKIILLVPQGFLSSDVQGEIELRKELLEKNLLSMVISFPPNLLRNTGIRFSVIVIDKARKEDDKIKFADASSFVYYDDKGELKLNGFKLNEELKKEISSSMAIKNIDAETVLAQDCNLDIKRYFGLNFDGVKLGEVCEFILPQRRTDITKGKYVRIRDLKDSIIDYTINTEDINETSLPDYAVKIEQSCILLASKWNTLKPSYFSYSGTPLYISQDIFTLSVNSNKVDVAYLISQLSSKKVVEQAELYRSGSSIPFLKKTDILNIKIELPELLEQQRKTYQSIVDVEQAAILREAGLEHLIEKIKKEQRDDLSIKKHNIMQHLNNVKASAESLILHMNKNGGSLDSQSLINPARGTRVIDSFSRMINSLNDALFFVDNITNDAAYEKLDEQNIEELLFEARERTTWDHELFEIRIFVDKVSLRIGDEADNEILPLSDVSKKEFFELFNNIIENATRHGFADTNKKYLINIRLSANLGNGNILISFENNGKPFPSGMAERYCLKGEKAGRSSNTGIGSWKVCEIARYFGGSAKAYDFNGQEFPVRIDVQLPLKQINYL